MLQRPSTTQFRAQQAGRIRRSLRSLLTSEQLNLALHRESQRVDRKDGGCLVLLLFRFRGEPDSPATMRLARSILHRIRITDDVGWFDSQHIGVILPDTAPTGAWRLAQQICSRMEQRFERPLVVMYSYPGTSAAQGAGESVLRQTEQRVAQLKVS